MSLGELLERICHDRSDHQPFRAGLLTLAAANMVCIRGKAKSRWWRGAVRGSNSFLTPSVIGLLPEA